MTTVAKYYRNGRDRHDALCKDIRQALKNKQLVDVSSNNEKYSDISQIFPVIKIDKEETTWDLLVNSGQLEDDAVRPRIYAGELFVSHVIHGNDCAYHSLEMTPIDRVVVLSRQYDSYFDIRVKNATYARLRFGDTLPYDFIPGKDGTFTLPEFTRLNQLIVVLPYESKIVIETDGVVVCNAACYTLFFRNLLATATKGQYYFSFRDDTIIHCVCHGFKAKKSAEMQTSA